MTESIRHIIDRDGDKLTDFFYAVNGTPTYSRLLGHLTTIEAILAVERLRKRAAHVEYVQN